jgi:trehalose 6-phosphate synthase
MPDSDPELGPRRLLGDRRLILVSNREPYVRKRTQEGTLRFERTTGGLVTALDPVMRRSGGVWVAWDPGSEQERKRRHRVPAEAPQFTLRQVPLTTKEVRRYYYGFANRAVWPLCHYFVDRCRFDEGEWRQYVKVNERFAQAVDDEAGPDDLIWIHDYHFCLLPRMVRNRRRGRGPVAFFLHIPFPALDVFKILPWRRQILEGLLGADLVAFHVPEYSGHFLRCCRQLLGARADLDRGEIHWEGRTIKVGAFPIGVDVAGFEKLAATRKVVELRNRLARDLNVEHVILGVDRLDYSKGIPQRLLAIDCLLRNHPKHRRKACFVQIAVPSRTRVKEYRDLKREIDELVGRINGRWGDSLWQPIRYVYRSLSREELVAHYRAADVALVTPLRDGMNLVAKEYCACDLDERGVLLLSEFTGAAQTMEGAILVNPFAVEEAANLLDQALAMEPAERRRRMVRLRRQVAKGDIQSWLRDILTAALESGEAPSPAIRRAR